MTTWDDKDAMAYRPPTFWDYVAGLAVAWGIGAICGAMLAMWIGGKV